MRLLVLCTHNSARSQMAEGWLRRHAEEAGLDVEVWSAGTEKSRVQPQAIEVMRAAGVDISGHHSKTLYEIPDPWQFDLVLTVCDSANESCPSYPAHTRRVHTSFPDPSGQPEDIWREVRDAIARMSKCLLRALGEGRTPSEEELLTAADVRTVGTKGMGR